MLKEIRKNLTLKIVIMVLVIILPLNIVAIISLVNMNSLVRRNTEKSLQNITDLYMSDLSEDMQEIDQYLFTEFTSSADGINVCAQDESTLYENSKIWLMSEFQTRIEKESYFSGFFAYLPRVNEYLFVGKNGHMEKQRQMKAYLTEHLPTENIDRKWKLLSVVANKVVAKFSEENFTKKMESGCLCLSGRTNADYRKSISDDYFGNSDWNFCKYYDYQYVCLRIK